MSKLNGRKVIQAHLHTPLFVQGFGQLESTLTSASSDPRVRTKNLEMEIVDGYLLCKFESEVNRANKSFEVVVPTGANVKSLLLEPPPVAIASKTK